ncbi:MAG: hypothetical protein GX237_06955 [Clostridiales bacterium]|nr:hypothetical protein [Clostridiales bacterium]
MIRRKLIKTVALGLCMSVLYTGAAYASSGGGSSSAYGGKIDVEYNTLIEMQREMDQYLFVDNVKEIERLGFTVVYTGVAEEYVEVGITPYSDKNADYIYNIYGKDHVKVVSTDEVVLYAPDEKVEKDLAADQENEISPVMDMGDDAPLFDSDTTVSDALLSDPDYIDEEVMDAEKEKMAFEEDGNVSSQDMDDLIRQTDVIEDLPTSDLDVVEDSGIEDNELSYVTTQDDTVRVVSTYVEKSGSDTSAEKDTNTGKMIALIAGGTIVLGGVAFASTRKKAMKKDK